MKLIIDRTRWQRGSETETIFGCLKNEQGHCCILGFLGEACGVDNAELVDSGIPFTGNPLWPDWIIGANDSMGKILGINDEAGYNQETRESKLKDVFQSHGIELEFIN